MAYAGKYSGEELESVLDKAKGSNPIYYVKGSDGIAANTTSGSYRAAQWKGTNDNITSLYDGLIVAFRVQVAGNGTYGTTLNINNLGEHPVVYNINSMISTRYGVNSTVILTYNSTQTATAYIDNKSTTITGCWQVCDYDTNDANYTLRDVYLRRTSYNVIYRYQFCLSLFDKIIAVNTTSNSTATNKTTFYTGEFNPFDNIYFYNNTTTLNANTNINSSALYYKYHLADIRYSFNNGQTLTSGKGVYLVATLTDEGRAKLYYGASGTDYTKCLTQIIPTVEDNLIYIYLGQAYDTYRIEMNIMKRIYIYKFGDFITYETYLAKLIEQQKLNQNVITDKLDKSLRYRVIKTI